MSFLKSALIQATNVQQVVSDAAPCLHRDLIEGGLAFHSDALLWGTAEADSGLSLIRADGLLRLMEQLGKSSLCKNLTVHF